MAVDDISVDSGIVGEREKFGAAAWEPCIIDGQEIDSDGNHAVFGGKEQEKIREKGKRRGAYGVNPEGSSIIAPQNPAVKQIYRIRTQNDRKRKEK